MTRREPLVNGEYYHIYNKSINDIVIFPTNRDLDHALLALWFFNHHNKVSFSRYLVLSTSLQQSYLEKLIDDTNKVDVISFSLMPNHYHLILKQNEDGGISKYISDFQNCLTRYFNKKANHQGSIFKQPFQSKIIDNNYYFLHVCRYVIINPVTGFLINTDRLTSYPYTSFPESIGHPLNAHSICKPEMLTSQFSNQDDFAKFITDQADYKRNLSEIGSYILE